MTKPEQKEEEKYVMVCPKCKSPDIEMDTTNPVQPAFGLPPMYICHKCGHSGNAFPEVPMSEIEEFEKEAKKEGLTNSSPDKTPKTDSRYGNFGVRVLWKISGPILLLLGIFLLFIRPIFGTILMLLGLLMIYITYFKKRKIRGD
jgi:hypothetical protein